MVTAVPYLGLSASPYTATAMPVVDASAYFNKSGGANGNAAQATIAAADMVTATLPNVTVTYNVFEYGTTTDSVSSASFTAAPAVGQCINLRNQTTSSLTVQNFGVKLTLPSAATLVESAETANDGTFLMVDDGTMLYGITVGGSLLGDNSESLRLTRESATVISVFMTGSTSLAANGDADDSVSFCFATYALGSSNTLDQAFRNNIAVGKYGAVEMLDMVTNVTTKTSATSRALLGTDIAYSNALLGQPAMTALLGASVLQDSKGNNVVVNSSLMNVSNIYVPAFNLPSAVEFGVWTSADGKTWSSQNVAGFTAPNYGNQVVAVPGLASKSYVKIDLLSSSSATGFKPIVVQLE